MIGSANIHKRSSGYCRNPTVYFSKMPLNNSVYPVWKPMWCRGKKKKRKIWAHSSQETSETTGTSALFWGLPSCCLLASIKSPCLMESMVNQYLERTAKRKLVYSKNTKNPGHICCRTSLKSNNNWTNVDCYMGIFFPIHTPIYSNPDSCLKLTAI